MNLTTNTSSTLLSSFNMFLLIGFGLFFVMMLGMVFLYGLSMKETLKNTKGIIGVFVISLLTPLIIGGVFQKNIINNQASQKIEIKNLKLQSLSPTSTLLTFYTPSPIVGYIEYKDLETNNKTLILQSNKSDRESLHSFIINNIGKKGGEVTIIVDGKKYLVDNNPIKIPRSK